MPKTDPRIDAYIEKSAAFAQPILTHLRTLVHEAVPEAEEAIKWGMPHFTVNGKNLAGMAAFKAHASFGIWPTLEEDAPEATRDGMGSFGKLASLSDLPDAAELTARLQKGAAILRARMKAPPKPKKPAKPLPPMPDDLAEALAANAAASAVWDGFAPSHKREYLDWVIEAKRAETRAKRIAQAVEWIADGKQRNWKYMGC